MLLDMVDDNGRLHVNDWWDMGTNPDDYIDDFNDTYPEMIASDCEIKERYTDAQGNDLADVIFIVKEV